jgi:hypothetical protein
MASNLDCNFEFNSISDALKYLYKLSLDSSNFRFRGQANLNWTLMPSIYRYSDFKRYQTVHYESQIINAKPPASPPLTHTDYHLEWLMICQHYGVPTRLLDWSNDILTALYFACADESEFYNDGALFICDQSNYPKYAAYSQHAMDTQELTFVSTNVINPRMRAQLGCFMIWGHAPLSEDSKESYDLWKYHSTRGDSVFLEKICIPCQEKPRILKDLKLVYGISADTLYLKNGYLENQFGAKFEQLREDTRLKTLYMTNADTLTAEQEKKARSFFDIECRNMLSECISLNQVR